MGTRIKMQKGQRFGMWTVLEEDPVRGAGGVIHWICKCDCGKIKSVNGTSLRNGKSYCCGCVRKHNNTDMIGKKFGKLTVLKQLSQRDKNGSIMWECQCECGNHCKRSTTNLHRTDRIQSCGCYNKTTNLDLSIIGKKFGKLTVLEYVGNGKYKCQCDCGNIKNIRRDSLTTGNTQSCGCINYSIGEYNIKNILKENNIQYQNQYTEPSLKLKKFDFAIFKNNQLIRLIEFDGEQHFNDISGIWNSPESLQNIQQRDNQKNKWAKQHNIPLVRIPYWQRDKITLDMILGDQYLVKV